MADTEDNKVWLNTLAEKELADKLDEMVKDNGSTRAAFIRLLIEREYEERKRLEAQKKSLSREYRSTKNNDYRTEKVTPT